MLKKETSTAIFLWLTSLNLECTHEILKSIKININPDIIKLYKKGQVWF